MLAPPEPPSACRPSPAPPLQEVLSAKSSPHAQVQPLAEAAIAEYLLEVRRGWGTPINDTTAAYAANVYQSRVLAAILGVTGVVNVTNVTLNGAAADLRLIESGELQQVPIMGTVTLNG